MLCSQGGGHARVEEGRVVGSGGKGPPRLVVVTPSEMCVFQGWSAGG